MPDAIEPPGQSQLVCMRDAQSMLGAQAKKTASSFRQILLTWNFGELRGRKIQLGLKALAGEIDGGRADQLLQRLVMEHSGLLDEGVVCFGESDGHRLYQFWLRTTLRFWLTWDTHT
jgi:hypothetical protein